MRHRAAPQRHKTVFLTWYVSPFLDAAFAALVSRAILTQAGHRATLLAFTAIHASLAFPSLVIVFKAYNPKRNNAIVWIEHEVITDRRFWCLALSIAAATL